MKKGIGKRAKEILRKLLQGRGMRRLAIGLALMIPVAGYAGDAHGWAAGQEARSQPANAVKVHIPGSLQHAAEIHQR
ncbi:ATPase [Paenibacillus thiaminolyticus]|nr:ATPase [Paenibacillus thiaminolyticus]